MQFLSLGVKCSTGLLMFPSVQLILVDRSERGHYLVELISEKQKQDQESQASENLDTVAVLQMEDTQGTILPT